MKTNARHKKSQGPIASIGIGVLILITFYVLSVLISSAVLGGLDNPLGGVGVASIVSFFPPALISGFLISKIKGEGGVITAGASAFTVALMLFLCCAVMTHGNIPLTSTLSYVAYVILAVMGGILGRRRGGRKYRA